MICGLWNRSSVAKLCIPDLPDGQAMELKIRLSPVSQSAAWSQGCLAARYAVQARLWLSVFLQVLLDVRIKGPGGGFCPGKI